MGGCQGDGSFHVCKVGRGYLSVRVCRMCRGCGSVRVCESGRGKIEGRTGLYVCMGKVEGTGLYVCMV